MDYLELLALVKKKDPKGLEALYVVYGQKFYGYAVAKWQLNEDQAWEVIYKTLETLLLKLSEYTFDSKGHFENFIFKVFINYLRQHYRIQHKNEHLVVHVDMAQFALEGLKGTREEERIGTLSVEDYSVQTPDNPQLLAVQEALDQLPETDRDILLLRAQNYSYEEIAAMLHLPGEALKVRHFRAKQKLLKLLQTPSNETI